MYSEIEASILANSYTISKGSVNVACAFADTQLQKLLEKVYAAITFLDYNTDGGFSHSRVIDSALLKRSGQFKMINGNKVPTGWLSQIQGIVVDKPGKLRGDRTDILMFEECFGKDTLVIMADYSKKAIQDIKVGDFVLGINGLPQEVMHICSGKDKMYKVKQTRGLDYIVNSKHKLYLERRPRVGKVQDHVELMTASLFLDLSAYNQRTTYGKTNKAIDNQSDLCKIDPYYLGCWLGDGSYESLSDLFKQYDLINNKHIPQEVFKSTLNYKLNVLAGLIDTDGNISRNKRYEIAMSRESLIQQIGMLARSCGFDVAFSSRTSNSGYGKNCKSYRVTINGNISQIPVKVARKKCTSTRFNTTNSTPIKIEEIGQDEYYGITLKSYGKDSDNLFLLEDFTIVHNCGLWPSFTKAYTQADALVGQIGRQFGLRILGGRK